MDPVTERQQEKVDENEKGFDPATVFRSFISALKEGRLDEAKSMVVEIGEKAERSGDSRIAGLALVEEGHVFQVSGDLPKAHALYERAVDYLKDSGHGWAYARALNNRGYVLMGLGRFDESLRDHRECLALRRAHTDCEGVCRSLMNIGFVEGNKGDFPGSLAYLSQALEIAQEHDLPEVVNDVLSNMSMVHIRLGDFVSAIEFLDAVPELGVEQTKERAIWTNEQRAELYRKIGKNSDAIAIVSETLALEGCDDFTDRTTQLLNVRAQAYAEEGDLKSSMSDFNEALALREEFGEEDVLSLSIGINRAKVLEMRGEHNAAIEALRRIHGCYTAIGNEVNLASTEAGLASALGARAVDEEEHDEAMSIAQIALERLVRLGVKNDIPAAHALVAELGKKRGDWSLYSEHIEESHRLKLELLSEQALERASIAEASRQLAISRKAQEVAEAKNVELQELNRCLELLNTEKNELLDIASHDLKNPLASIALQLDLLERDLPKERESGVSVVIGKVRRRVQGMINLITRLLDTHAIDDEADRLSSYAFDLGEAVRRVVEVAEAQAIEKGVSLSVSGSDVLTIADRPSVMQIAENLISNGLKYTPSGGTVHVEVEHIDNQAMLRVTDTGPGIPEEERDQLFRRFGRISTQPTAGEEQTGLGLWIVRRLCEAMGGAVEYRDVERGGAQFLVRLKIGPSGKTTNDA